MTEGRKQTVARSAEREARLSSLDISEEAMREMAEQVFALVSDCFTQIREFPVFPDQASLDKISSLARSTLPLEGVHLEQLIDDCRTIINASRHNGHPRFFGYVASPSTPVGAFADLFASALNQNVTAWRSAPAATEIERAVVRWLSTLVGYGEDGHGILTSGGSMANLIALIVAQRAKSQADVSRKGLWGERAPMTVYASDQIHLSIPKAADVSGLGREQVRLVESDSEFRLDVRALRERLESDTRQGLRPFCVVASAGTVTTGAVDRLDEVARVASEHGLWFHVDGAYGAYGALDETKRALFKGIEQADSLSLDAHKWLYAPLDCGCLLMRDEQAARQAFTPGEADYIKVQEQTEAESFAFWDYGIELSRRFRAMKIWLMLRYYGAHRVAAAIAYDNQLAAYLAEQVRRAEDFELLAPVELSICCFRYVPHASRDALMRAGAEEQKQINRELDELNARILHATQRGGRAYLSTATLRGRYSLRACITNFRTTRQDIDETLDAVREVARQLSADAPV
jgi:aromatic-L-amino-acid decarboxylase